ncbi:ATP-binding cassette domain-containing protein [Candidatus Bathyarchaeota archaeon]|nr:ATP-binding cassette domain-containing protein [Candidatus Bathyarchaeota archaeon]
MIPVEVSSVKKSYGDVKAVDGVSFSVNEGEVFALLGPNGAGKTTLIEILEGLRKRDEGAVKVLGLDPWRSGALLHRRIGVIPQDFTFFEKANPKEAVKYYSELFGASVDADEILRGVVLEDSAGVLFENLSGGQKQKLGLALSLVNSAELLFLDEPTTGLDPNARRAIWDVIRGLRSKGKTVILTTHYLDEAEQLSDRVAIMNHGRIVAMGTSDEIIETHGSGERLEIHGNKELADYIKAHSKLKVEYKGKGLISIAISKKHDALAALTTVEESGLEWRDLHTRRDSLDDVFVKLVRGRIDEKGEIRVENIDDNSHDQQRG